MLGGCVVSGRSQCTQNLKRVVYPSGMSMGGDAKSATEKKLSIVIAGVAAEVE